MSRDKGTEFMQWALPRMGYKWSGFRKPRGQVLRRIRGRLQELGLTGGYTEYKSYLRENPAEWDRLDELCDVTISKFFRDRKVWEFLRDEILPSLLRSGLNQPFNIWSAGSCNGEEPYSIAIVLEQLPEQLTREVTIAIVGTDRNPEVLQRAKAGRYPAGALKELTEQERNRFFRRHDEESDIFLIRDFLKSRVEFEQRDIRRSLPERPFDLIFCRNLVFTYFSRKYQQQFLQALKSLLKPGAYLVTGSNEKLPDTDWLVQISQTHPVYQKA